MSTRFKIVVGSLVGSVAIHIVLMMCSPGPIRTDRRFNTMMTLIADAIGSREATAAVSAGPGGQKIAGTLDVANEDCSRTAPTGGPAFAYAQHAYPGMSAAQLSQVRTIGHAVQTGVASASYRLPAYPFSSPEGFTGSGNTAGIPAVYVRDGMVAVLCGPPSGPWFDSVTFTLVE